MSILRAARRPAAVAAAFVLVLALAGVAAALRPDRIATPSTPSDASTVHGRVVDVDGRPIEGVSVAVASIDAAIDVPDDVAILTDANGEYRTPALPAGRYELVIGAAGYRPAFVLVTVADGASVEATEPVLIPES